MNNDVHINKNEDLELEIQRYFGLHKEYFRSPEIILDLNDLKEYSDNLVNNLLYKSKETLEAFRTVAQRVFLSDKNVLLTNVGNFKEIHKLQNKDSGELFTIKGIIKKITKVILRTVEITYECASCGCLVTIPQDTRRKIEPRRCGCGK